MSEAAAAAHVGEPHPATLMAGTIDPALPSILPPRVRDPGARVAAYGEAAWPLAAMGRNPATRAMTLVFDDSLIPAQLLDGVKRATFVLLNQPTPAGMLESAGSNSVERLSATGAYNVFLTWRAFAAWAGAQGVGSLSDIDADLLGKYAIHVRDLPLAGCTQESMLLRVRRLWALRESLPVPDRLHRPPWLDETFHFPRSRRGENATAMIDPATMGPLLVWAMAFVGDLSADILTGKARAEQLTADVASRRGGPRDERLRARQALLAYQSEHGALPAIPDAARYRGRPSVAVRYLGATLGFSPTAISHATDDLSGRLAVDPLVPTWVHTPVLGRIADRPWAAGVDFYDVYRPVGGGHGEPRLVDVLRTACLIVVAYLTGTRPHEALALEVGCCPAPLVTPEGATRFLIHGTRHKGVPASDDGHPAGRPATWTTVKMGADAVAVAEKLAGRGTYLFPNATTGEPLTALHARERLRRFIGYANTLAHNLALPDAYRIPDDPRGPVTLARFRRTVSWHIRNRRNGPVALAVQYQHLTRVMGDGYAGAKSLGMQRLFDQDEAAALVETLHTLDDDVTRGMGVSGPAAGRARLAARTGRRYQGAYLGEREARALLHDPALQAYDNPAAYAVCMFDPGKALCRGTQPPSGRDEPDLTHCQPNCANIARTDRHAAQLGQRVAQLRADAASALTPEPLSLRLAGRADHYQTLIDQHEHTKRTTPPQADAHVDEVTA